MRLRVRREPKSLIPEASGGGIETPGSQERLQLGEENLLMINRLHDEALSRLSANFQLTGNVRGSEFVHNPGNESEARDRRARLRGKASWMR